MTLRELLDKGTPRPWITWNKTLKFGEMHYPTRSVEDAALIVALVNHAEDFIALYEAARWTMGDARDRGGCEAELESAVERLRTLMEDDAE